MEVTVVVVTVVDRERELAQLRRRLERIVLRLAHVVDLVAGGQEEVGVRVRGSGCL